MLLWLLPAVPLVILSTAVGLRVAAARESALRQRLRAEGVQTEATVTAVSVPATGTMVLSLNLLTREGDTLSASALAPAQPNAHASKGETVRVVYLPSAPRKVRLVSDLDSDWYAEKLSALARRHFILAGLAAMLFLLQLLMHASVHHIARG